MLGLFYGKCNNDEIFLIILIVKCKVCLNLEIKLEFHFYVGDISLNVFKKTKQKALL